MARLRIGLVALAVGLSVAMRAAQSCELELVLAVDVSGSVNVSEYDLQSRGLADAFRSSDIVHLIRQTARRGAVFITMVQWSGTPHQAQIIEWRQLHDEASIAKLAEDIDNAKRAFINYSTAIGEMMTFTGAVFGQRAERCRRRVVDVSGDGPKNEGGDVGPARARLLAADVTINGLAIIGEEDGLADYYRDRVIGGNGAFMITARTFADFPDAIRRKLLREIAPSITQRPRRSRQHANLNSCHRSQSSC